ncbi:hypothetical protein D3C75_646460 [compost metagenome]
MRDGFVDTGMYTQRQAVSGGVDLVNQCFQVVAVVAHHVQHRAKHLFLHFIEAFQLNQCRCDKSATLPLFCIHAVFTRGLEYFAAFTTQRLDVFLDILFGLAINHRADVCCQAAWVAHAAFCHRAAQHLQRVLRDVCLNTQDAQGRTTLACAIKR